MLTTVEIHREGTRLCAAQVGLCDTFIEVARVLVGTGNTLVVGDHLAAPTPADRREFQRIMLAVFEVLRDDNDLVRA